MERVAFLVEETGERLSALLNPESLVMKRRAGLRSRRGVSGQLTGTRLMDDPLLYTGGGATELQLDLLFDTFLAGEGASEDVRDLTRPLWQLAENARSEGAYGRPPLVRFLWGKVWNYPGIVQAVAERVEQFAASGAPRRSWLRMRLLRSAEPPPPTAAAPGPGTLVLPRGGEVPPDNVMVHEVAGAGPDAPGERLDAIAERYYGNASLWRVIATFNGIGDPLHVPPGTLLRIPPLSVFASAS
ncbi:MAG TPA: hypothetical protein VEV43_13005 [Actinomycetota bacterium]|nr:hypothetical protein [Actinomycetota bacterium]